MSKRAGSSPGKFSNRELAYSRRAEKFLLALQKGQPKHAKQIVLKLLSLCKDPLPPDSLPLKGEQHFFRTTVGEYRIIYTFDDQSLIAAAIGKRNDGDIYQAWKNSRH